MPNQNDRQSAREFAQAFAESLSEFLEQVLPEPWRLTVVENPAPTAHKGEALPFRVRAEGTIRGNCFIEFYEPQAADLVAKLSGEPRSVPGKSSKDAIEKLLSAVMPALSANLSAKYGGVTLQASQVEDLAFGGMYVVALASSAGEADEAPVMLYFDGLLLSSLSGPGDAADGSEQGVRPIDLANLKLVMDVELNVTLRFGQRQLPLREVLELSSGSVVELDRQVDDPVELLLDGKVIARGEAVIVDGNYGLRITEIPQPISAQLMRL